MKNYQKQFGSSWLSNISIQKVALFIAVLVVLQSCAVEEDPDFSDPRDKFIGTWNVSDQPSRINYTVDIVINPAQSANVILNNFGNMGGSANGLVVGNRIIIDKQDIGSDFLCKGEGSYISENSLKFEFELDDGIELEAREAIFTK